MTIAGYILAGGKNRRMDGRKKLFLEYGGEPFFRRILRAFHGFSVTYLSVEEPSCYEALELPLIVDAYPQIGPVGGICTGLQACPEDALFVAACDMPLVDAASVDMLLTAYENSPGIVVAESGGRVHPLLGIYPKTVLPILEAMIGEKNYRMMELLSRAGYTAVTLPEESAAAENINTPEAYQMLLQNRDDSLCAVGKETYMLELEDARACLLSHVRAIGEAETVGLFDGIGRILAEDVCARQDQPPFPRSPLDGYAVRGADTRGAKKGSPVKLRVIGKIYAGSTFPGTVGEGEAVRIMTGAPIPDGADAVIRQEDTDYGEEEVFVEAEVLPYQNYCHRGEDYKKGDVLLERGSRINGIALSLLAGAGCGSVQVVRKARIAVLSSGDELVLPGEETDGTLPDGKIYNTNLPMIAGRMMELGTVPAVMESCPDDPEKVAGRIRALLPETDLIITTGGVSVGQKDIMHEVIRLLGAQQLFRKVRIKPGTPTFAAVCQGTMIICLSGNPYAAAANFELLVRPVVGALTGDKRWEPERVRAVLQNDSEKRGGGMRRFVRGLVKEGRVWTVSGNHSSGALSSMVRSNCLIDLMPGEGSGEKGSAVWVYLLGDSDTQGSFGVSRCGSLSDKAEKGLCSHPFVFAVSGYKNSGKTTLITRLVPELISRGYRVAVLKHDGHDFIPDVPGTDSYRHRESGAYATAVFSDCRFMVTKELPTDEAALMELFPEADIILIEGMKHSAYPKYFCRYPEEEPVSAEVLADEIERLMQTRKEDRIG